MKVLGVNFFLKHSVYTFIHHEGSKYMKTIRKTNTDRKLQVCTWEAGRQTDGKQTNNCHK